MSVKISTEQFLCIFWEEDWEDQFTAKFRHGLYSSFMISADICVEQFTKQYLCGNYIFCSRVLRWCRCNSREFNFVRSFFGKIAIINGILDHEFFQAPKKTIVIDQRPKQPGMTLLEIIICSNMIDEDIYIFVKYILSLGAKVNMYIIISAFAKQNKSLTINLLLDNFDLNERDDEGNTLLHVFPYGRMINNDNFRLQIYHYNVVESFHYNGLFGRCINKHHINIKNNKGMSPLQMVINCNSMPFMILYITNKIGIDEIADFRVSLETTKKCHPSLFGTVKYKITMANGDIREIDWNVLTKDNYEKAISQQNTIIMMIINSVIWKIMPMPIAEEIEYYIDASKCEVLE